ncbi:hypothetical protein [Roseateles sp. P5_D6]
MLAVVLSTPQAGQRVSCRGSLPMEIGLYTAVEQFDAAGAQSLQLTWASDVPADACRALGLADLIATTAREDA